MRDTPNQPLHLTAAAYESRRFALVNVKVQVPNRRIRMDYRFRLSRVTSAGDVPNARA
jgi:hypothetical protein